MTSYDVLIFISPSRICHRLFPPSLFGIINSSVFIYFDTPASNHREPASCIEMYVDVLFF